MVIAMNIDLRLGQIVGQQDVENLVQRGGLLIGQHGVQMAADVPLGEQIQFALQQRAVVRRQRFRLALGLQQHQCVDRIHVQLVRGIEIELVQVGNGAEVGQQQKALRDILRQNARHGDAGGGEQVGDVDEGFDVFLRRRSVHDDQAAALLCIHAEIAAKAGVGRGRTQGSDRQARFGDGFQPFLQLGQPEIA